MNMPKMTWDKETIGTIVAAGVAVVALVGIDLDEKSVMDAVMGLGDSALAGVAALVAGVGVLRAALKPNPDE